MKKQFINRSVLVNGNRINEWTDNTIMILQKPINWFRFKSCLNGFR